MSYWKVFLARKMLLYSLTMKHLSLKIQKALFSLCGSAMFHSVLCTQTYLYLLQLPFIKQFSCTVDSIYIWKYLVLFFFILLTLKGVIWGQTLWKEKALLNIFFGFCRTRDNWVTLKWRLYSDCAHASKSFVRECFCFPYMRGWDGRTYWPTWKHEHSLSQSSRAIVLIATRVDCPWIFLIFPYLHCVQDHCCTSCYSVERLQLYLLLIVYL